MSDDKIGTNSYCVGGRYPSSTESMDGCMIKTGQKMLIDICVKCDRKKSLIVIVDIIAVEGLREVSKNLGSSSTKACKDLAPTVKEIVEDLWKKEQNLVALH